MSMPPSLQLVIPCYNEARRLKPDVFLQLTATERDIGLVFVDDGSRDGTAAILADIAARGVPRVTVLTLEENAGKATAVQRGILEALTLGPEFVGFWDADLSTPLTALPAFMEIFRTRPAVEIVMGARVKLLGRDIRRSLVRHYCGRAFATAASFALGIAVYDTQCGAKIFRATDAVRQVFSTPFQSRWIFDVELLARYLAAAGNDQSELRICELPLDSWTAVAGSKLTVRHAVRAVWDLVLIARR